jgi:hypothetical protein
MGGVRMGCVELGALLRPLRLGVRGSGPGCECGGTRRRCAWGGGPRAGVSRSTAAGGNEGFRAGPLSGAMPPPPAPPPARVAACAVPGYPQTPSRAPRGPPYTAPPLAAAPLKSLSPAPAPGPPPASRTRPAPAAAGPSWSWQDHGGAAGAAAAQPGVPPGRTAHPGEGGREREGRAPP